MNRRDAEATFEHEALGAATIPELVASTAARHPDGVAQSYKGGISDRSLVDVGAIDPAPNGEYADLTYGDLETLIGRLAAGFREIGLTPGDRLAIVSHTRMEWTQVDLAALAAGGVVTTAYPSATDDRLEYLLSDPEPTGIVIENSELLRRILAVESRLEFEFLVVIDSLPDGSGMAAAARDRDDIYELGRLYQQGETAFDPDTYESWLAARGSEDLASIIYTSGTTGEPKGVQLTHGNFVANVDQTFRRFGPRPDRPDSVPHLDHTSRHLSVLPLAHVFERLVGGYLMIAAGAAVAYAESPKTLASDFRAVSPTSCTAVPQLYERLFDRFEAKAEESPMGGRLFEWAVDVAKRWQYADDPGRRLRVAHSVADRLVYSGIREALGGDIELFISGGDSLSADLCAAFHGMGLPIFEGYGLTETAPVVSVNPPEAPRVGVNPPEAPRVGTIGPPLAGVETRLDTAVDIDGLAGESITTDSEIGELLVRGPNVTNGYWKHPEATAEAFVSSTDSGSDFGSAEADDRWLRTGDLVERLPDGHLVFRGRRKQLIVLSTGKNVAPDAIETAVCQSPLIEQCLLVGDGRPAVAALVVPDVEGLRRWADSEGVDLPSDPTRIVSDSRVRDRIEREIESTNNRIEPYERIKEFQLVAEPFSVDNGLLTPTLKKQRHRIVERYADRVDDLF